MYGQTEATARMAWLPPELAEDHPDAIGIPIPGGSFRLDTESPSATDAHRATGEREADGRGPVGELVYSGPNVMLGYARHRQDLALGRTLDELHTGDLARRRGDGLWELVGRASRFAKPFGLRVDLRHLETLLEDAGIPGTCVAVPRPPDAGGAGNEAIGVAVPTRDHVEPARAVVCERTGLPASAVLASAVPELPRRANGKVDLAAVAASIGKCRTDADSPPETDPNQQAKTDAAERARAVFRRHFPAAVTDETTFVDLGGDSLCYLEVSMDLEAAISNLPTDWHLRTVADLAASARRSGRLAHVEVGAILRALGIVLVVGRHVDAWALGDTWRYWYVEALVHLLLVAALAFCLPAVRRSARAAPFGLPLGLTLAALAIRFGAVVIGPDTRQVNLAWGVAWLFLLGWPPTGPSCGYARYPFPASPLRPSAHSVRPRCGSTSRTGRCTHPWRGTSHRGPCSYSRSPWASSPGGDGSGWCPATGCRYGAGPGASRRRTPR